MKLKQRLKNIGLTIRQGMKVYLQSFFLPSLYRDVAYREEGYGLKRILWTLVGFSLISYVIVGVQLIHQYEKEFKPRLMTLPNLVLTNHKLEIFNQSLASTRLINPEYFEWTSTKELMNIFQFKENQKMILNSDFLWFPYSGSRYFGYCFSSMGRYFPAISWVNFQDFVNGKILVENLHWFNLLSMLLAMSIPIIFFNGFFVILFIRMFAYIAKNMVMLALKEALDYKLTCRLLSLSGIPTMSFMAFIINVWGLNENTKFYFMIIYMFYYYLSLRLIRAKSYFKWMNT